MLRAVPLAIAAVAMVAAGPAMAKDTARELVIAVQNNPPTLEPTIWTYNVSLRTLYNLYDFPIDTDFAAGWTLRPGLATAWQRVDDRTLDLTLREGVTFHDGTEMTAEDVAFSWGPERIGNEDAPGHGTCSLYLGTIDRIEVLDRYKVRLVAKEPDPLLERRMASWCSQVVSKAAYEAAADPDAWGLAPIGTGPYKVKEFVPGDRLVFEAHESYWGEKPPFATVRFQVVPEQAARIAGLAAGDFQMITEVDPDQIQAIESRSDLNVVGGPIVNYRVLNIDTDKGWLANVKVRRALSLAIDRKLIVEQLWDNRVGIPNGFQWEAYGDTYVRDDIGPEYDPEKAKALLAEAGYDGSPIAYRTQQGYYTAEILSAQAIADMWRAVGVNVDLQVKENWGQIFAQPVDAVFNGSINMNFPDMLGSLWPLYGPTGFIRTAAQAWDNQRFVEIGTELTTEFDDEKRAALHRETLDIFHEVDPPSIVLHELGMFYGIRDDIDWSPYPLPYMDLRARNITVR